MQELKKEKLALILSYEKSHWRSCQVIVPNLVKLYRKSFPHAQLELFNYSDQITEYEYFRSMRSLLEFAPDKIIFCDHKPHPARVIKDLMRKWGQDIPPIYCHLFGDFSLYTVPWFNIETYLQKIRIKFIAASHRQVNFVRQFIERGEELVSSLPFPVDEEKYQFSPGERTRAQKKFAWDGAEVAHFLYTGRLSAQKNIIPLIQSFRDFLKISGSRAQLHIAGSFDDMAYPFFGLYYPPEFNRCQFFQLLEEFNGGPAGDQIHFLGNLETEELRDYYQACDIFVSLSLHNDEDYGMSAAEALCCGMPLILSDWGGHASFCLPESPSSLVSVKATESFYGVDYAKFVKLLIKYDQAKISNNERSDLSLRGRQEFSIEGNIKRLLKIHSDPIERFSSWNKRFQEFSNCFNKNYNNPFGIVDTSTITEDLRRGENRIRSRTIYRECYDEYISGP